jgi:hypothetical protein
MTDRPIHGSLESFHRQERKLCTSADARSSVEQQRSLTPPFGVKYFDTILDSACDVDMTHRGDPHR